MAELFTLNKFERIVFKFQPVANVDAKRQQRDGNLGDHAGIVILDIGIITANIRYSTEHKHPPCKIRP